MASSTAAITTPQTECGASPPEADTRARRCLVFAPTAASSLLLVPISAHALFSRALVVSPSSEITVTVEPTASAVLACDGRRSYDVPPGAVVTVRRGAQPVRVARLHPRPFTDRLVAKFGLPVAGWRTNSHEDH